MMFKIYERANIRTVPRNNFTSRCNKSIPEMESILSRFLSFRAHSVYIIYISYTNVRIYHII